MTSEDNNKGASAGLPVEGGNVDIKSLMPDENQQYSIALRVRRITYEDGYVAVPVDEGIVHRTDDGNLGINPDAFVAEAVRISKDPRVQWRIEEQQFEAHPVQCDKPEDRGMIDGRAVPKEESKSS